MMKGIYLYMTMCAAAITFAACTNEMEESTMSTDALVLTVGDFPAFQETPETRAVGTFDPGTEWKNNDKVLVRVTDSSNSSITATLTYNGGTWSSDKVLTCPKETFTVEAWYAPAYAWSNNELSSNAPGTGEFFKKTLTGLTERNVEINFSDVTRNYSRLRFASSNLTELTVTMSNFTPAGDNTSSVTDYTATLTTDSKGNAYLYGSWNASTNLTVSAAYLTSPIVKTLSSASTPLKSYALDTPQLISAIPADWNNKSEDIKGYYRLTNNISLTEGNWTPIGTATSNSSSGKFAGTFDGAGYTISNLKCSGSERFIGLFRFIGDNGVVKNLNIENCNIVTSGDYVGGIAASSLGAIENCHVSGTISGGETVGGIIGYTQGGIIVACSNSASITGSDDVGGITGDNRATLLSCFNTGTTSTANNYMGAICGWQRGSVTSCYFSSGNNNGNGTYTTSWTQEIVNAMNATLQQNGYDYLYGLEGGKPVINNP